VRPSWWFDDESCVRRELRTSLWRKLRDERLATAGRGVARRRAGSRQTCSRMLAEQGVVQIAGVLTGQRGYRVQDANVGAGPRCGPPACSGVPPWQLPCYRQSSFSRLVRRHPGRVQRLLLGWRLASRQRPLKSDRIFACSIVACTCRWSIDQVAVLTDCRMSRAASFGPGCRLRAVVEFGLTSNQEQYGPTHRQC
jgi:hypothetical protein